MPTDVFDDEATQEAPANRDDALLMCIQGVHMALLEFKQTMIEFMVKMEQHRAIHVAAETANPKPKRKHFPMAKTRILELMDNGEIWATAAVHDKMVRREPEEYAEFTVEHCQAVMNNLSRRGEVLKIAPNTYRKGVPAPVEVAA